MKNRLETGDEFLTVSVCRFVQSFRRIPQYNHTTIQVSGPSAEYVEEILEIEKELEAALTEGVV